MFDLLEPYRRIWVQKKDQAPFNVQFYDFWNTPTPQMWFYRFIQSRNLLPDKKEIYFFSVFGDRSDHKLLKGTKLFYTGENVRHERHRQYSDYLLSDPSISLSLGFEYFEDPRYLRFPFWILQLFRPEWTEDQDIISRCQELRKPPITERRRFACMVSSQDVLGIRTEICNSLSGIDTIDCGGKIMHNCDDLWNIYDNDKKRFLSNYKFNICPENSNCAGYVTEKVFQAIDAGCIPIYWGSYNHPEPDILNPKAIVFWEANGCNENAMALMQEINSSATTYLDFCHQDRLIEGAEDVIINYYHQLEQKLKEIF